MSAEGDIETDKIIFKDEELRHENEELRGKRFSKKLQNYFQKRGIYWDYRKYRKKTQIFLNPNPTYNTL